MPPNRGWTWFLGSVVIILVLTASLKLWSLRRPEVPWYVADPLLPWVRQGWMAAFAALLELTAVAVIVLSEQLSRRLGAVLWLGSLFVLYRLGLWAVGHSGNCNCLGQPGSFWFSTYVEGVRWVLLAALAYMIVGAAFGLWWCRKKLPAKT